MSHLNKNVVVKQYAAIVPHEASGKVRTHPRESEAIYGRDEAKTMSTTGSGAVSAQEKIQTI